jgi:hypothetical protein
MGTKPVLAKAELYEVLNAMTERLETMDVTHYEDIVTERSSSDLDDAELIETLTIRWRRLPQ